MLLPDDYRTIRIMTLISELNLAKYFRAAMIVILALAALILSAHVLRSLSANDADNGSGTGVKVLLRPEEAAVPVGAIRWFDKERRQCDKSGRWIPLTSSQ